MYLSNTRVAKTRVIQAAQLNSYIREERNSEGSLLYYIYYLYIIYTIYIYYIYTILSILILDIILYNIRYICMYRIAATYTELQLHILNFGFD